MPLSTRLWNSAATGAHPDVDALTAEEINLNAHIQLLTPGVNLLAIHALNASADDDDFLIRPELLGSGGSNTP